MGYSNVREYKGGKAEWIAAGLPVETGKREPTNASTEPQEGAA